MKILYLFTSFPVCSSLSFFPSKSFARRKRRKQREGVCEFFEPRHCWRR